MNWKFGEFIVDIVWFGEFIVDIVWFTFRSVFVPVCFRLATLLLILLPVWIYLGPIIPLCFSLAYLLGSAAGFSIGQTQARQNRCVTCKCDCEE